MLNKNKQNQRLCMKYKILCAFTLIFVALIPASNASAQNVCQITNPAPGAQILPWLAPRPPKGSCSSRQHLGVDIMLATCTPVNNQSGCSVIMNSNGSPLHKVGGYGYYMRYSCNSNVEVRYAHLRGYDGDAQMAIVGYSGAATQNAPHIHYEIYADSGNGPRAVDPECVWGDSDVATCCRGVTGPCLLGNGPADMCNPTVLKQLSDNHSARASGGSCNSPPNGYTSMALQSGIPVDQIPPGKHIPPDEPTSCGSGSTTGPFPPPTTVIDDETPIPFTPRVITGGILTPSPNPGPPPKGTPGGPEDLTPPSTDTSNAKISGCAPDTWTAMVNQAVLEARRENIMNQRLIAKSDSVLNYTCFDQSVKTTGQKVGPIFSENNTWKSFPVNLMGKTVTISRELGNMSLDVSLTTAVDAMSRNYIRDNFTHGLLGETATVTAPKASPNCDIMNNVWKAAKCKNADGPFYTFNDLVGVDPRTLPSYLTCGP